MAKETRTHSYEQQDLVKDKGKFVPVLNYHAMKTYWGVEV